MVTEIDAGAAVTVMLSKSFNSLFPKATLRETTVRLCTYMAKEMPVLGKKTVIVQYGDYSVSHTHFVHGKRKWTMSFGKRLAVAHKARLGQYKNCVCDEEY